MRERDTGNALRKIALVVASLDRGDAERLLKQFTSADARRIRDQWESLDAIDPDEQESAIVECLALLPQSSRRVPQAAFASRAASSKLPCGHDGVRGEEGLRDDESADDRERPLGEEMDVDSARETTRHAAMRMSLDTSLDLDHNAVHDASDETGAVELDDSLARKFADRRLAPASRRLKANPTHHPRSSTAGTEVRNASGPKNSGRTIANQPPTKGRMAVAAVKDAGSNSDPKAKTPNEVWEQLARVDSSRLGRCLEAESPVAIAIVLARLPASHAAETLHALPRPVQLAVVERMSAPSSPNAEWVETIGEAVWERVQKPLGHPSSQHGGSETLAAILAAADPRDRARWQSAGTHKPLAAPNASEAQHKSLSHAVEAHAVEAHTVEAHAVEAHAAEATTTRIDNLADLARLHESTLAMLVTAADPWLFALALAGAEPAVAQRWMERLGPIVARDVQRQLTQLGPWRLSDAVEAERRLVRIARDMVLAPVTRSNQEN